ncbi:MAG: GNAT family N-acetyltransferase [Hyphomicrobiaceae bacterium]
MVSVDSWVLGGRRTPQSLSATAAISVEVARGREAIDAIAGEWRALYALASAPEQVFLSPAWIETWYDHYMPAAGTSGDGSIVLVTCRQEGRLALVWPLVETRRLGLKLLKWAGEPVSQYGDILVVQDRTTDDLLETAWEGILSLGADALILRKTRRNSQAAGFLLGKGAFASEREAAPYIDLDGIRCPLAQAERYSAKDRKNRRRQRKRLSEIGPLGFRWLGPSATASLLARHAVALKRTWLTSRGRISKAFTDQRIEGFLAAALSGDGNDLDGRVGVLDCDGRPAALLIGFLNRGYLAGYLTAYDAAFERHGPGSLLFEDVIRSAIGEQIVRVDLLAPADAYKLDWASGMIEVEDLCLPLTVGGNIYTRLVQSRVRHSLKTGIDRLPPRLRRTLIALLSAIPAVIWSASES